MVTIRKDLLINGEIYHIFNRSIAEFKIFNDSSEFSRMLTTISYYQNQDPEIKLSKFIKFSKHELSNENKFLSSGNERLVEIIAYCLMPTHLHLILKQMKNDGISIFMSNIQNSYARYFNIKIKRKGHLWEGTFKNVLVKTDEQLMHLTRYLHLNPVTAYLVNKPEEWSASSYKEYISQINYVNRICRYDGILDINSTSYKDFVEDRISYQRDLAKIKELILE